MKSIKYLMWVCILVGPLFGHLATVLSLLVSLSYILYLKINLSSWVEGSKYWESTALYWYESHIDLIESHPEDVREAVESYQIKEVMKGKGCYGKKSVSL